MKMAKEYVDFVRQSDGYALLLADNHECAVPRKAHMMFEQDLTPQEQLDYSVELYSPIKRNIKGAVTGNHAWRAYHDAGIELDKEMMARMGILHHYYRIQGQIELSIGKCNYRFVFSHGNNIGSNVFRNCDKLNYQYPTTDIVAASHAHIMAHTSTQFRDFDKKGRPVLHKVDYITTGSLLDQPLYGEIALYKPQPKGFSVAWLHPTEQLVFVDTSGKIPKRCPI